jgi:hypothetical protein
VAVLLGHINREGHPLPLHLDVVDQHPDPVGVGAVLGDLEVLDHPSQPTRPAGGPHMAKVHVPQSGGDITIAFAGDEPTTYAVTDHEVTVPDGDVARFVAQIDGAKPVRGNTAAPKKETT